MEKLWWKRNVPLGCNHHTSFPSPSLRTWSNGLRRPTAFSPAEGERCEGLNKWGAHRRAIGEGIFSSHVSPSQSVEKTKVLKEEVGRASLNMSTLPYQSCVIEYVNSKWRYYQQSLLMICFYSKQKSIIGNKSQYRESRI